MGYTYIDLSSDEEFQSWLFYMPYILDDFMQWLPEDLSKQMDFSLDSLIPLEAWLIAKYPTHKDLLKFDQRTVWDAVSRYVGEVVAKAVPAKWSVDIENRDDAYFRRPVVSLKGPFCPSSVVSAACHRQRGDYILKIVMDFVSVQHSQ
jgi:hypothetical protein